MNKRFPVRSLSMLLAFFMLLSVAPLQALAAEIASASPVKEYTFDTEDQDDYQEIGAPNGSGIWNHSAVVRPSTTDPENNVLAITTELQRKEYDYYFWKGGSVYPIPNESIEAVGDQIKTKDGCYVNIGGVDYTFPATSVGNGSWPGATLTQKDSTTTISGYIITAEFHDSYDTWCLSRNLAFAIQSDAWSAESVENFVISMDLYLAGNTKNTLTTELRTAAGKGFVPMKVVMDGSTGALQPGAAAVEGGTTTLELGKWYGIILVIDKATSLVSVYVDRVLAFSSYCGLSEGAMSDLAVNTLGIFLGDGSHKANPDTYRGSIEIDNLSYYATTKGLGLGDAEHGSIFKEYSFDTEDQDDYQKVGSANSAGVWNHSAVVRPSATNPENNVLAITTELQRKEYDYYFWKGGTVYPIPNESVEAVGEQIKTKDGCYVNIGGVDYTFPATSVGNGSWPGATLTQKDSTATISGYIITAAFHDSYDTWCLSRNQAFILQSDAWAANNVQEFVISMDWYFEEGSKNTFITELRTAAGKGLTPLHAVLDGSQATLKPASDLTAGNAVSVNLGEWYQITIVIDKETALFSIYVNGEYAFSTYCGANAGPIGDLAANALWMYFGGAHKANPTTYCGSVEIDNITYCDSMETLGEVVTVDAENLLYVEINGKKIYQNSFFVFNGASYNAVYFNESDYAGLLETEQLNSVRLREAAGLRFGTKVDTDLLDQIFALLDAGDVTDVQFGHLIVPADYLDAQSPTLTKAALDAAGKYYVNVLATRDAYFSLDDDSATTHFVGSIVDLYEQNVARDFAGRGYVSVTLHSGQRIDLYSPITHIDNVKDVATDALTLPVSYTEKELEILNAFKNGTAPTVSEGGMITRELRGLNVLAIGDSLFNGHYLAGNETWLAMVANAYEWNFTNLGVNGSTIAKDPAIDSRSMYDHLVNNVNYKYGGSAATYTCGNVAGVSADEVDLILLEGGINDYQKGFPIGDMTNADDLASVKNFTGAVNQTILLLKQMYPNATILLTTSWHNPPTSEFSVDALKAVKTTLYAEDSKVLVLDAGNPTLNGGVDMSSYDFRVEYGYAANDSYHLNVEGMKIMADHMPLLIYQALAAK